MKYVKVLIQKVRYINSWTIIVNSIENQKLSIPLDILIRDDGSLDGTIEVIKKLNLKYHNIKLVEGKNLGCNASFFELFKLACGYKYYAISDQDDIYAVCELADYTRELVTSKEYEKIAELVRYILDNGLYEAFNWVISAIQEQYAKEQDENESCEKGFSINLGRVIKDYDEVIKIIEAEENACESTAQSITDRYGEVESFFNIQIRKTKNNNMYLVSAENFDVRDNDFILYKLLFTRDLKKYIERLNKGENLIDKELEL